MRKRLGQSHFQISGPVVQRNVPESSGFLLVFFLLTSGGLMQCFIFKGTLSALFLQ